MKKEGLQIGLLYLSFHNSLKKVYGTNRVISKKDIMAKLGRQFLVPKPLRILAIKELVGMNLLKKEPNDCFKILDYKLNVEEDTSKFFKRMKLFSII